MHEEISAEIDSIAAAVVEAAFKVHRALGPGLLESVYEACMCHELAKSSIPFQRQLGLPVVYDGCRLESGLRIDLLVADAVVVELKSAEQHQSLFEAQLLTYLKLSGRRLGLLINFNVRYLKDGIKRVIL